MAVVNKEVVKYYNEVLKSDSFKGYDKSTRDLLTKACVVNKFGITLEMLESCLSTDGELEINIAIDELKEEFTAKIAEVFEDGEATKVEVKTMLNELIASLDEIANHAQDGID